MNIPIYLGTKRRKDALCAVELAKYIEGDRSDRVKDLILKGLIFEGREDIPREILDPRYTYRRVPESKPTINKKLEEGKEPTVFFEMNVVPQIEFDVVDAVSVSLPPAHAQAVVAPSIRKAPIREVPPKRETNNYDDLEDKI